MPDLIILRKWDASLVDALAAAGPGALALCYAPGGCSLFRVADDVPGGVFEVRLFTPEREVRWVEGQGAALLAEEGVSLPGWKAKVVEYLEKREDCQLLWGRVRREESGDAILFEHRVGEIRVPFRGAKPDQRLGIVVREYLAVDRQVRDDAGAEAGANERAEVEAGVDDRGREIYGNVAVVAERLIGLRTVKMEVADAGKA